jgi:hypothetical protein
MSVSVLVRKREKELFVLAIAEKAVDEADCGLLHIA